MVSGKKRWWTALVTLMIGSALAASLLASSASAAGTCSTTTPQYCPAPTVGAVASTAVTNHSATLAGYVTSGGLAATCTFQYGPTTSYGMLTQYTTVPASTTAAVTTAPLVGLEESTTFHYRLVCYNAEGFGAPSSDAMFTTLANTGTTTPTGPSTVAIVNGTGFVSSSGIVGLFISCFGSESCAGTFTIKQGSKTIASAHYSFGADQGGPVNAKLSAAAFKSLKKKHVLSATAHAADTAGPFSTRAIHLHLFR